jgi:hypothetical protein
MKKSIAYTLLLGISVLALATPRTAALTRF